METLQAAIMFVLALSCCCEVALKTPDILFYADHRDFHRTHAQTESFCAKMGGVIPTAKTHEYPFLRDFLPHHSVNLCFRLAGHKEGDQYFWDDGAPFEGHAYEYEPIHCVKDCRLCLWQDGKFVVSDGSLHANAVCQVNMAAGDSLAKLEHSVSMMNPSDRTALMTILAARKQAIKIQELEAALKNLMDNKSEDARHKEKVKELEEKMGRQERVILRMERFMDTLHELLPASDVSFLDVSYFDA